MRVPLYEAPDEPSHVAYVESLAFDHELPDPETNYEAQHGPLYYALEAAVVKALFLERPVKQPLNPEWIAPGTTRQYMAVFQHPDEAFPWRGPVLTVQVMRAVTVLFGAGVVMLTYATSLLLFPARRLLAVVAAATCAFVPQFAFISGTVNNDIPAAFFAGLTIYCGLRFMKEQESGWLLASAVALGLALAMKSAAAIVGIVPLVALLTADLPWQRKAGWLGVLCAAPLLLAGWYNIRSLIMWGELFPSDSASYTLVPRDLDDEVYLTIFYDQFVDSYWYNGGWLNILFPELPYRLLMFIPPFAAAGVILYLRRRWQDRFMRNALLLAALLPFLALAAVVQYSVMRDFGPQGRYLFPAQTAIALLLPLGIGAVFTGGEDRDHPAMLALPLVLLLLNAWVFLDKLPEVY